MPMGVLSGFNPTKITTTAATRVAPAFYVTARVVSNTTTATTLAIYNTAGTSASTSAGTQIALLRAAAGTADELGAPVRCDGGSITYKMSVNSGVAWVYTR